MSAYEPKHHSVYGPFVQENSVNGWDLTPKAKKAEKAAVGQNLIKSYLYNISGKRKLHKIYFSVF